MALPFCVEALFVFRECWRRRMTECCSFPGCPMGDSSVQELTVAPDVSVETRLTDRKDLVSRHSIELL